MDLLKDKIDVKLFHKTTKSSLESCKFSVHGIYTFQFFLEYHEIV